MSAYGDPTDPILNPPTLNFFWLFQKKKIPTLAVRNTLEPPGTHFARSRESPYVHSFSWRFTCKWGYVIESRVFPSICVLRHQNRSYFRCENGGAKWGWKERCQIAANLTSAIRLRRNWRNRGIWSSSRIVGECFARWWGRCAAWFREIYRRIDRWQWSISAPCYEFVHSPMIDVPLVQITNKASDFFLLFYFEPFLQKFMQETDRYRAK